MVSSYSQQMLPKGKLEACIPLVKHILIVTTAFAFFGLTLIMLIVGNFKTTVDAFPWNNDMAEQETHKAKTKRQDLPKGIIPFNVNKDRFKKSEPDPKTGRDIYQIFCSACHGKDGKGKTRVAVYIDIPNITELLPELSDDDIYKRIAKGTGSMPEYKTSLTEREIRSLILYLKEMGR